MQLGRPKTESIKGQLSDWETVRDGLPGSCGLQISRFLLCLVPSCSAFFTYRAASPGAEDPTSPTQKTAVSFGGSEVVVTEPNRTPRDSPRTASAPTRLSPSMVEIQGAAQPQAGRQKGDETSDVALGFWAVSTTTAPRQPNLESNNDRT